jgi:hypothetical protein
MAIPWRAVFGGFLDGFAALFLIFRKVVRYPGSESEALMRLTTAEALAKYREVNPEREDLIVNLRETSLEWDRKYTRTVRIVGGIEIAAIVFAICFLLVHKRF